MHALMSSEEARAEVLPRLADAVTAGFATREIVDACGIFTRRDRRSRFRRWKAGFHAPAGDLLHQIVAADEMS